MDARAPVPGAPALDAYIQQRPAWAASGIDAARTLFVASPAEADANLLDVAWSMCGSGMRMRYAEGATVWISAALDEVWVAYEAPLTAADAAHFLLEPVLAFILRRRGTLVLHASAVELDGRAAVFFGSAGAGKSTTAGACVAAGGALLSDDVVTLAERSGEWWAHRGTSAVRLWDDGVRALGADPESVPQFSPTWDKRVLVPATLGGRDVRGAAPMGLACLITPRSGAVERPRLEPIERAAALTAILPHTAANYLHDAERRSEELGQLARLVSRVPIVRLIAGDDSGRLPEIAALLRARAGA